MTFINQIPHAHTVCMLMSGAKGYNSCFASKEYF